MAGPAKGSGGRPRKPVEQKKRTGNPGKRALPTKLAVVPAIEPADHELTVDEALDRVLERGVPWIAATDAPVVALLREAIEDYAELRSMDGMSAREVRDARKQVMDLLSRLGFDPTARSALGLAEVKAQSKLEGLLADRASRQSGTA